MVPRWRFFGDFLRPVFSADIQSATAEIKREKEKKEERRRRRTGQGYNGLPYSIGDHKELGH